jgi:hypothetical protein
MNKTYLKNTLIAAIAGLLALASLSFAAPASATTTLDATDVTFDFYNEDDINLDLNEPHLYEDIATIDGTSIDARLTMIETSESAEVDEADNDDTFGVEAGFFVNCGENCDPFAEGVEFTPADGFGGFIRYTLEFFEAGTEDSVILTNLSFFVNDIDDYQYIEVLDPNSYILDAETALTAVYPETNSEIAAGNVRFQELNGVESSSDDQPHWVKVKFNEVSVLNYQIGQDVPGGLSMELLFDTISFDNPVEYEAVYEAPVPLKISKKVFFDGDSAYLKPIWFKKLDKMIASVPTCATDVTAKIFAGVKKAKSEVKGSNLAKQRAAIVKKFLTKRGLNTTITLKPNGKGTKAKNNQRFAKIVVTYNGASCTPN